jgi:hypothetical protein
MVLRGERLKTHKILIILGISVLSCLMLFSSCAQTGYKTFRQTKGCDHYSFDRPAAYWLTVNMHNSDPQSVNGVRFVGKTSIGSEIDLTVNIGNHAADYPDAQAAADRMLTVEGRELIDRSVGTVSGVPCQLLALYTEPMGTNDTSKFQRVAFFDYNGRLWDFGLYSERSDAAQVDTDFGRLLSTFTLLP